MFLFKNEALRHFSRNTLITTENFYRFFPWNFGPFSREVYDDLTFFYLRGFIEQSKAAPDETVSESLAEWDAYIDESDFTYLDQPAEDYEEVEFRLTDKGRTFVEKELYPRLSSAQRELLKEFKKKIQSPLRAILRYVYSTYPDFTTASQIKDKVLG